MPWNELMSQRMRLAETCLVIGNGPSLNDIPFTFLHKYPSFGTNRIYLLNGFTPDYYVCVNPLVLEQFLLEIAAIPARAKFIAESFAGQVPGSCPLHSVSAPIFSTEPDKRVYEGHTVTYVCLQLAFWLGFKQVLLVGVDHNYAFEGKPNEEHTMPLEGADPNHFASDYFQGVKWNNPDLVRSERAYAMARTVFSAYNRRIVNCTTRTKLEVFDRGDWHDYA